MTRSCHTIRHFSLFLQLVIRDSQYLQHVDRHGCRKRDFSNSSVLLFPALLSIFSKRCEGFPSPSCIPEIRSLKRCSSESAYYEQCLLGSVVYGFSAGGLKMMSQLCPILRVATQK
ncbi:hypothetical protein NPIL_701001 [Nephila pilipes]|uniref:Uncharacterized protein n=1 Tax=Nephila pilipes TaxID=299642 RepID=A0A8X6T8V3_NEPPI|nr:hypothetical protein NPIL_701001 [Nephila pilipes]